MNGWLIDPHRLRALRIEARWTVAEIAHEVGCHYTTWYRYERGLQPTTRYAWRALDALAGRLGRPITMADIADPGIAEAA